jgi:phenylacetate-coenzyme A ligase PaaK-like adenylate-forming protein
MGDLRDMVARRGVEQTLRTLRGEGVYITFDEMKGREPIVRHGDSFAVTTNDFNNPLLRTAYEGMSGGSTGVGTRVSQDLDHLAIQSAHLMLAYHAHGVLDAVHGVWRGVLPDGSGMNNVLRGARHGRIVAKWFVPAQPGNPPAWRFQVVTYGTVLIARLCGVKLPWPEMVPIDQAIVVAKWAASMVEEHGCCHISAPVSRALRVAIAARDAGIDLTGTAFVIAGEPPSPAKVAGIAASGARCFTTYGFVEAGRVAIGCVHPSTSNDLHILTDAFEVMSYERQVPGTDARVTALNITSLLLTSPQILLNAEVDDYGVVEDRSCGCPLERVGYHRHVRDIHSYRKLTGEGVTLVGGEMIEIMERVLPARFGGSPLDFQLMEEEDERGFTRLSLVVSPRLQIESEQAVIDAVMQALHTSSVMADSARGIWAQAGTMRVKRMEPIWTGRGKLLPLHLVRRPKPPASDGMKGLRA